MAPTLCQNNYKNLFFCQKAQNFVCLIGPYDFVQITLVYDDGTENLRSDWRDFRLPMSELATVAQKNFIGKFDNLAKENSEFRTFAGCRWFRKIPCNERLEA